MRYYIDTEFDGHNGPLLSIAMVSDDGRSIHIKTTEEARDPWVIANVIPLMDEHHASVNWHVPLNDVGVVLREFIGSTEPVVIADSPVDIGRFCDALTTSPTGGWASAEYRLMTFEVHNVDCYPTTLEGAVQHNAWWDAMALRRLLTESLAKHDKKRRRVNG